MLEECCGERTDKDIGSSESPARMVIARIAGFFAGVLSVFVAAPLTLRRLTQNTPTTTSRQTNENNEDPCQTDEVDGQRFFKRLILQNLTAIARTNEPVHMDMEFQTDHVTDLDREIRKPHGLCRTFRQEMPSQIYGDIVEDEDHGWSGSISNASSFATTLQARYGRTNRFGS